MARVYLSLTARLLVNVEALNMAETVGNLSRHKRVPVAVPTGDGRLEIRLLPAVSGQALAHGYQVVLARRARERGLPVCKLCEQGVLVKHSSREVLERLKAMGDTTADKLLNLLSAVRRGRRRVTDYARSITDFERLVVEGCVVEDVGGFLFAGDVPVRRTSCISFSYMIPSLSHADAAGVESVLHSRNDPVAVGEQMIYSVEVGAALYTFSVALDLCCIGRLVDYASGSVTYVKDRLERVKVAIEALAELLTGGEFGAKRSRILPHMEVESVAAAVVSGFRFQVPGGHSDDYILQAVERLSKASRLLGGEWRLVYHVSSIAGRRFTREPEGGDRVVKAKDLPSLFERLVEWGVGLAERCQEA